MDIILYLIELIQTRKEIGLYGLGTLYKKKSPGRYDAETHLFLPPSYILDFTPEVRENHNLAQFISKKRNISIESSTYFISQFVSEVEKELKENGSFQFENLGKLSLNNGELHFSPAKDINFGFDFYGLPPVNSTVEESTFEEETTEEEIVATAQNEDLTLAESIAEENKIEEENPGDDSVKEEIETETVEDDVPENEEELHFEEFAIEQETPLNEEAKTEEDPVEKEKNTENDDWNFDEFADLGTIKLEEPIIEEPEHEPAGEQPFVLEKNPEVQPTIEEEEVFEEIAEVTPPISQPETTEPIVKPEEIDVDFAKSWEFDEEEVKVEEKTNEIILDFDEETGEELVEEDKGMPQYMKVLLGILVILVAVVIIYFINPNLFSSFVKNDVNPDQKIAVPIAERENLKTQKDSLAEADEIMKNAQDLGLEIEKPRDTLKATVIAKPLSGTTYEVISVAFQTQKEVDAYIKNMKAKGIVAKPVPAMPGKLMMKVSIATFNNLDSAYKELPKLKKTLKNQGLYIYTNKQK